MQDKELSIEIREERPDHPAVVALLEHHLTHSLASSPPESSHVLDLEGLLSPSITFLAAWQGSALLGIAALKELDAKNGEVKSMHTSEEARGQGIARRLLVQIVAEARARGYLSLSLETGTMEAYAAARRLYLSHGFRPCPPFGGYRIDPHSAYFRLSFRQEDERDELKS